jgi:hypothetical protein
MTEIYQKLSEYRNLTVKRITAGDFTSTAIRSHDFDKKMYKLHIRHIHTEL